MERANTIAICVTGWHFEEPFYRQLAQVEHADIFIIAHKPALQIPAYLQQYVQTARILVEANLGYDWGCYQQFLNKVAWHNYDYVFFIHDDVTIKDLGFIERSIALLHTDHLVIGNGRVAPKRKWADEAPQCYAHASWKPARDAQHDVVRGSFFATTRQGLELLQCFEVFWDPLRLTSGFGNWSTKASCAKWEHRYGENCFGFLSEEYCHSQYLEEHVRGNTMPAAKSARLSMSTVLLRLATRVCGMYTTAYWQWQRTGTKPFSLLLLKRLVRFFSGNHQSAL
ncbi:MAG: hypothetical protein KF832_10680 [Caldilineaceae bacterium]|nr:hypothetical protein [Caldilineaceae bacterium]